MIAEIKNAKRIDANGLSTEQLLGEFLKCVNDEQRMMFLTHAGQGDRVIHRIRMRLSRLRNAMDAKNRPKKHFRLRANRFPYTNLKGKRMDCIVLEAIITQTHVVAESVEGMFKNANASGDARTQVQASNDDGGFQW